MATMALPWSAGMASAERGRKLGAVNRCQCASSAVVDSDKNSARPRQTLVMAAEMIPHPDKLDKGGEDAFLLNDYAGGVLAIADGVSGWAEHNVDPALFSKELLKHLEDCIETDETSSSGPKSLLGKAHALTTSVGAATAILAILLEQERILRVANLGDCGIRIIRQGKVIFASSPQQHYFDCPFQFSSEAGGQSAEDAAVFDITVEEGDIIVMASDGLFDNVYDQDIVATVNRFTGRDQESAQQTAKALATLANRNSRDTKYESPYVKEAIFQGHDLPLWRKLLGQKMTGGKLDDITVLVAYVETKLDDLQSD